MVGLKGEVAQRHWEAEAKRDLKREAIRKFLYEEGPHTAAQISKHFGMSRSWALDRLEELKDLGEVTYFKRSTNEKFGHGYKTASYWILASDAQNEN